jgi:hypothetical protein
MWFGWLWAGEWQRVCRGETLAACGASLARIARRKGVRDADTIMTGGAAPSYRPHDRESSVMRKPLRVKTNRKTPPPIRRPPRPAEPRPDAKPPEARPAEEK